MKGFEVGDEVIVIEGRYKGVYGSVIDQWIDSMVIAVGPDQPAASGVIVAETDHLEPLPVQAPYEDAAEEPVDDIPVHAFGIPVSVLEAHLGWFVGRSLERVGDVGPEEALFGFQEFEGKSPQEVILELMGKLEEGTALLAQTHILLGRIVMALENMHDQN